MNRTAYTFIKSNWITLIFIFIGIILGYLHWYHWGCYWGTYPFSSELWVNCCYGGLFSGFICSFFQEKEL